ncbi:hypothetical protein CVT26_009240 [Gymnopilus dilepis]|uniref:Uncharacterized protein n=1 Tax=Gymnopilus dilepis TaxID=231916 RepID=A0A409YRM6_9AGAR|nr:hypothetical protein CVT26_009240 [Gymnopilus dilepis]
MIAGVDAPEAPEGWDSGTAAVGGEKSNDGLAEDGEGSQAEFWASCHRDS